MEWTARAFARLAVLAAALVLLVTHSSAQFRPAGRETVVRGRRAVEGDVLVKFRRPLTIAEDGQLKSQIDAERLSAVGGAGTRLLHSRTYTAPALVDFLAKHPDVLYAEPNYILHQAAVPSDPAFGQLWGLRNLIAPGADIGAVPAWDVSTGSRAHIVGVVDSGLDYTHPDLAANVWIAPAAFTVNVGWMPIACAAGSHGFNAIANSCDPVDGNGHGTHVSGIIGAVGNNGRGVTGVNWTTSLMGLKFLDSTGTGTTANAINAIEFAVQAKAVLGVDVRVLSNSWGGGGFSQALLDEISKAAANGILFVAASGNSGGNNDVAPMYPASYAAPNVVSVTATDDHDALASFANYGPSSVHLGAPGVDILSTFVGGGYAYASGTSMAVPYVAGAAALVLSRCALDTPALRTTLLTSIDPVPSLTGVTTTGGRLNVNRAIRLCSPSLADFSLDVSPPSQTIAAGQQAVYGLTVSALDGFADAVSFDVVGLPTGAIATFTPATVAGFGSSTLTIATSTTTPAGTFPLTVVGTSGGLVRTATTTLTVAALLPDFSVAPLVSSQTISGPAVVKFPITIAPVGRFAGRVALKAKGLPNGASTSFSPTSVTLTGPQSAATTLSVKVTSKKKYTYTVAVTGTSGSLIHTAAVTVTLE